MIWESINTKIDPDTKQKVRTRELFLFECPHCGEKNHVVYDTLYHQMEDHIMIYLAHENIEEVISDLNKVTKHDFDFGEQPTIRIVTDDIRFQEKLRIIDAGLDDRVIEIMKLMYRTIAKSEVSGEAQNIYFDYDKEGKRFAIQTSDGNNYQTDFNDQMYDIIKKEYKFLMNNDVSDDHSTTEKHAFLSNKRRSLGKTAFPQN